MWTNVQKFPNYKILIGDDFNAVLDIEKDAASPRYWRKAYANILNRFIEQSGLTNVWRAFYPDSRRYTWHSPNINIPPSQIDFFLVSDLLFNYSYDVQVGLSFKSDHSPIYYSFYSNRIALVEICFAFRTF